MSKASPDKEAKGQRILQKARDLWKDLRSNNKCLDNPQASELVELAHFIAGKSLLALNATTRKSRGGAVKGKK